MASTQQLPFKSIKTHGVLVDSNQLKLTPG
jgi:hypothetical protein